MKKINLDKNVYEALLERLHFIFQEFENIYISFSGEKDSGLLLNILLDFQYYPSQIIGVFIRTLKHSTMQRLIIEEAFRMLEKRSHLGLYWVCLPVQHALP